MESSAVWPGSKAGHAVISLDIDPAAVEQNYRQMKDEKNERLLTAFAGPDKPQPGDRLGKPRA